MLDRCVAPEVKPFGEVRLDFPEAGNLSCGVPIWTISGGDEAINRLSVYVEGGVMHEHHPQVALMTALMALEGSMSYDSLHISETFDFYGAWKSAQQHDKVCELMLASPNEFYGKVFPIMLDCIARPTFPVPEFATLKQRYAASHAVQRERVKYIAATELRRLYYGDNHPLAIDVTPEQIMALTVEDLREFHRRFYHPSNCRVIIAGQVTDQMLQLTDEAFSAWNDPDDELASDVIWQMQPSATMTSLIDKPGSIQAAIAMAIQAVGREHPDYLKLRVLCMVLGGYIGSRLMSNIREDKGYTYGIHAFLSGRAQDGFVGVNTECDVHYVWRVIDEVKREMQRLCDELIPMQELDTVRQHMISEQVKTLDTPFSVASYVASTLLYGVYPDYFNQQIHVIQTVMPEDLRDVARRYLRLERLRVVVAGDKSQMG